MKDLLLNIVQLKNLEEIISAARETIHRHRRRFLQRNLRACPENCLARETPVLIKSKGFVPIGDNLGTQIILNSKGEWVEAEIKSFGVQTLQEVKVSYIGNSSPISIFATPRHRWKLTDGTEKCTENLQRGDGFPFVGVTRKVYRSIDYTLGLKHGLIYGDGTAHWIPSRRGSTVRACKRVEGYNIRICSDVEDILPYFDGYPVSYPPSAGGDPVVRLYDSFSATHALKSLPSENETEDYLVGFFRGWLAADGTVAKKDGTPSLCCGIDEEVWVRRVLPQFGYYPLGSSVGSESTNFGSRKKTVTSVRFFRYSMSEDDFLIKRKRQAFGRPFANFRFVVNSVKSSNRVEEVFCATVPGTEDFVIWRGLLTGNCKGASMVGHSVVGCTNCGSPNADNCLKEDKFVPLFTKEELAQQFADQIRNPDVLLREYRDVTVFLWVLGAFDKQKKILDENIVEEVEHRKASSA